MLRLLDTSPTAQGIPGDTFILGWFRQKVLMSKERKCKEILAVKPASICVSTCEKQQNLVSDQIGYGQVANVSLNKL